MASGDEARCRTLPQGSRQRGVGTRARRQLGPQLRQAQTIDPGLETASQQCLDSGPGAPGNEKARLQQQRQGRRADAIDRQGQDLYRSAHQRYLSQGLARGKIHRQTLVATIQAVEVTP